MILGELLSKDLEKYQRIEKAKADFAFFCKTYLPHAFSVPIAEYQKIILDIINKRALTKEHIQALKRFIKTQYHAYLQENLHLEGLLDIEPRDHGKTTRMTQAFPLWLALTKEKVFVVILAASAEKAKEVISSIKFELEQNERILEDFGDLKTDTWSKKKIVLVNGNAIAGYGAGEALRGVKEKFLRPTHIICDDLLKEKDVNSPSLRDSLYKWFKRVVMNLGKGAMIVVVNTILHPDDLPSRLFAEIENKQLHGWVGLRFSVLTPEGTPLWPERWSLEDILKKKEQLGSYVFATEWENEPIPEEARKFKKEWFQFYSTTDLARVSFKKVVMAVDPATGKATGDYSAIVVAGITESGQIYVLDTFGERISDLKLIARIIEKFRLYKPEKIIFETQTFQEIYKNQLVREASKEGLILPVKGIKHTTNKEMRISKLSPLIESGLILFKEKGQELLLQQLEEFPKGHDDLPDALEMCVSELIEKKQLEPQVYPLHVTREAVAITKGISFPKEAIWKSIIV